MVGQDSEGSDARGPQFLESDFFFQLLSKGYHEVRRPCFDQCYVVVVCMRRPSPLHIHIVLVFISTSLCRDVLTMTMSDWQVFISVISPIVCSVPAFPAAVMELWEPLRKALLYFTTYHAGQQTEERLQAAQNSLIEYAYLAETTFGMHLLMTMQLHSAAVHLVDMVRAYGPAAYRMEFWVERMMQELKRVTKYRTSCSPELVAVNGWLLQSALLRMAGALPGVDALLRKIDPKAMTGQVENRDSHGADGNILTGALKEVDADQVCPQRCLRATYSSCIAYPSALEAIKVDNGSHSRGYWCMCAEVMCDVVYLLSALPLRSVQRTHLADTLRGMEERRWIRPGHKLYGIADLLEKRHLVEDRFCTAVSTTNAASIQHGLMVVKVFHGREGRRQDYQVFCGFVLDDGGVELAVMRVHALALIEQPDEEEDAAALAGGGVWPKRIAFGMMSTCTAVEGKGLFSEYNEGPGVGQEAGGHDVVYALPDLLEPLQTPGFPDGWYPYAIELQDIKATVVQGDLTGWSGVFAPYIPTSSHG